jgi:alkylation response protein AidB-like acyl-CoA dehydrogenase
MADDWAVTFLAEVRTFVRSHVEPQAAAWARGETLDDELFLHAARIGLTRMELPVADGGLGLAFRAKVQACAIIAAADFGLAMALINTHNVAKRLAISAPVTIAQRFLPGLLSGEAAACTALTEPSAGSDVAAMTCAARPVSGGWRLEGEKTWIVNARRARLSIVYAQTGEQGTSEGIVALLVDLTENGCVRYLIESGFSQQSMGTGGFRLNGCFVPEAHQILPAGTAFKAILGEINGARIYVAAMCCAMVSASLNIARLYGETRHSFGKPLQQHPAWREPLAICATRLAAAWALVEAAIVATESGAETRHLAAAAKVNAVTLAQAQLPVLLHAMGAEGLKESYPFARHIGAAQMAALTDGSTAMLLDRLARWDPAPFPVQAYQGQG